MRILLVSPYHGGSHQSWAEGLQRYSGHDVELLTLPARFWKWRMHGGAVTLARRFLDSGVRPDLILTTDMLDLSTFLALTRAVTADIPTVLYLHENQLTYPLPDDPETGAMRRQAGERDRHYGFINYASMLASERVVFNSRFHEQSVFEALPPFLSHFPEHKELDTVGALRHKSSVIPVGIDGDWLAAGARAHDRVMATDGRPSDHGARGNSDPPLVLWNQRWEYDKNPRRFLDAVREVAGRGTEYRLALCGQVFSDQPGEFDRAAEDLGSRVVHFGYAEPEEYRRLLWEAAVTASTAHHEFFGISVLEAMFCHTLPLLPDRLSYPEGLGNPCGGELQSCLYGTDDELVDKLQRALLDPVGTSRGAARAAQRASAFTWHRVAPCYDALFDEVRC